MFSEVKKQVVPISELLWTRFQEEYKEFQREKKVRSPYYPPTKRRVAPKRISARGRRAHRVSSVSRGEQQSDDDGGGGDCGPCNKVVFSGPVYINCTFGAEEMRNPPMSKMITVADFVKMWLGVERFEEIRKEWIPSKPKFGKGFLATDDIQPCEEVIFAIERELYCAVDDGHVSLYIEREVAGRKKYIQIKDDLHAMVVYHYTYDSFDEFLAYDLSSSGDVLYFNMDEILKAFPDLITQPKIEKVEWYGLIAEVESCRKKGMSVYETAQYLRTNTAASLAIIGALLHPTGDIKDFSQFGKDLCNRETKTTPW